MPISEQKFGEMEANIRHLTESFDEFKKETKDFHAKQTIQLDLMAKSWQEMGGVIKMVADIDSMVKENARWISKRSNILDQIIKEREEKQELQKNILNKVKEAGVLGVLKTIMYLTAIGASVTLIYFLRSKL